ncbi:MAG: hypothetical protein A2Y73_00775 [Chloroflexi bacterium RBG_13_56_8]|nr:MAG: hypothetical protein A2Y73_00775 [Chloroflexi bacterium RBG_13_56_8]
MITENDIAALEAILGKDNVSTRGPDLEAHSIDESWLDPHQPDVVVWPSTTQEISAVLRYANERGIPVVPWSGGSSLEGNPIPIHGGILLAMYRMDKILQTREEDLQVIIQPGVVYDHLNAELRRLGMFFPPAPGSSDVATIGGMVSNNSSGMRAVKYGVTRDYVQKLVVVLPSGEVITIGSNAKKSTSGYDLVSLFVGSEGTLGVVTEITLRLIGLPEQVGVVVVVFEELREAADAIYESVRYGLDPSAIELLDAATIQATNQQLKLSLREAPTLFVEFHGSETTVEEQTDYLREICQEHNCSDFQVATTAEARERLWAARAEAHDSIKFSHPGRIMISGDVCVPVSKFGDMVEFVHETAQRLDLLIYTFGHAGDGNIHSEIIVTKENSEEFARGNRATEMIIQRALELDGTVAGEHGVGLGKRQFMAQEHGASLKVMKDIKDLLDPQGIMNPGKIFPST